MRNIVTKVTVDSVEWWLELHEARAKKFNDTNCGASLVVMQRPMRQKIYYRGQQDATWSLQTSLERFCKKTSVDWCKEEEVVELEKKMLIAFKKKFSKYRKSDDPLPLFESEWHMKMRHYGLPSRMLDVTINPLASLYFSCWNGDGDFVVWEFHDESQRIVKTIDQSVIFVSPKRYFDDRIRAQSGAFIKQNRIGCSFEEAISETMCIESFAYMKNGGVMSRGTPYGDVVSEGSKIVKWIFPCKTRSDAKEILLSRSYIGDAVYPDISGAVESIMAEVSSKIK